MRPKLIDVATLAGVSKGTVSRVINKKGYISEKTKLKVEKAIKELNYYPNEVARSVSSQKSFVIGVIIPTINNPFWGEIIYYIERKLNEYSYKLMLCNSLNDIEKENKYLELLLSNQVDGLIVGSYNSDMVDYNIPRLPIVAIDNYLSKNIPIVSSDNYQGGHLAVKELINAGCKHIVTINGLQSKGHVKNQRLQAYFDIMKDYDLQPNSLELGIHLRHREKIELINNFLKKHSDIDGVFAQDDVTASHVLESLKTLNKQVPRDVKVVGYDGTQIVQQLNPRLTTVEQPLKEIASTTVNMLIQNIDHVKSSKTNVVLPVQLIKGNTT